MRAQTDSAELQTHWRQLEPLIIRYRSGELVYHAGSFAAGVAMLRSGIVIDRPDSSVADRPEAMRSELIGPGHLFGIEVLASPPSDVHRTSGRALTDVEVAFVERETLHEAIAVDHSLGEALLAHIAGRFLAARSTPAVPGEPTRDVEQIKQRLVACLLDLARMSGIPLDDSRQRVCLPEEITNRTLAEILFVSATRITKLLADPDLSKCCELPQDERHHTTVPPCDGMLIATDKLAAAAAECASSRGV